MSEIKNSNAYKSTTSSVVTIGTFDGVHIGHRKIVGRLIDIAKEMQLKSVILTFFPHPRMVLQKDSGIKLIQTIQERSAILNTLGIDTLVIKKFTKSFSRLSAEDFVKTILVDKLHAKKVIIGYDHRFGRNRNADINDLKKYGDLYGFEVEEIAVQDIENVSVSSTKIRKALDKGDVAIANRFLGHPFMLTGKVVKGKSLGRQIDFPTANIQIIEDYKLVPKHGAYIVSTEISKNRFYGMMNIGFNPTVEGSNETIEVHFFNFDQNIYNKTIQIDLLHRLRDEHKFESIEALKAQLIKDKKASESYIKAHFNS